MTSRWVIDDTEVVHWSYCQKIHGNATPYRTTIETNEAMVANLARPDVSNNHSAPSARLSPCDQCILGMPVPDDDPN